MNDERDFLDSKEFYWLMQAYRHMPRRQQPMVVEAFEAVKEAIRKHAREIADAQPERTNEDD